MQSSRQSPSKSRRQNGSSTLRVSTCWRDLDDLHVDQLRLRRRRLWQVDAQDALLELRPHLLGVDVGRHREAADELPVLTLHLVEALALLFLLLSALAFDREHAVLEMNLDLLLLHLGEIGLDDELGFGLLDVDGRHEVGERVRRGFRRPLDEEPVQPLLNLVELAEGIPSCELHTASCGPGAGFPRARRPPAAAVSAAAGVSGAIQRSRRACREELQTVGPCRAADFRAAWRSSVRAVPQGSSTRSRFGRSSDRSAGIAVAVLQRGGGKEPHMATALLNRADELVRDSVLHQLDWEPDFDASGVGIAVEDGVVTLTGYTDSYAAKLAAERAATRVYGVRAVANDIQVKLADDRTDTDVAHDCLQALR